MPLKRYKIWIHGKSVLHYVQRRFVASSINNGVYKYHLFYFPFPLYNRKLVEWVLIRIYSLIFHEPIVRFSSTFAFSIHVPISYFS